MDIFLEKIVPRRKTSKDTLITVGIIIGAIALIIVSGGIPILKNFSIFIVVGVGYFAYRFITLRNIEFEYAVTNGELDIDKIISQRKRKRIFSASCKDFDILAKVKSEHYNNEAKNIKNRIEAMSSFEAPDLYFAALNYKGERTIVFFEPNEKMLNSFKTFIPRKIFI